MEKRVVVGTTSWDLGCSANPRAKEAGVLGVVPAPDSPLHPGRRLLPPRSPQPLGDPGTPRASMRGRRGPGLGRSVARFAARPLQVSL